METNSVFCSTDIFSFQDWSCWRSCGTSKLRARTPTYESSSMSSRSRRRATSLRWNSGSTLFWRRWVLSASCRNLQSFQFYPWGHFYDQMFCRLYLIKTNGPSDLNLMSRTSKPLAISMTIGIMTTTTIMIFMATNDHPCDPQTNGPHDVDLSSHLDVFYTVYNRVQDTPQVKSEDYWLCDMY